jgi:hypothetical protein
MSGTVLPLAGIQAEFPDNTSQLVTPAFGRNGWESVSAMFFERKTLTANNWNVLFTDRAKVLKINNATAATVTLASGIINAYQGFGVLQEGAGTVTLTASGVTFVPSGLGPSTRAQGSLVWVFADPDVANQFWVFGDVV